MTALRCDIKLDQSANHVVSCIENGSLIGMPADSASPTDVYIFKFVPNTFYGNERVERGFMKVFISNADEFSNHFENEVKALEYEMLVYERTKKLVDNNVIGHFVKYFTSLTKPTHFDNLSRFISDKANISLNDAETNLDRNSIFMLFKQQKARRPAINKNSRINRVGQLVPRINPPNLYDRPLVEYKFILTEAVTPYNITPSPATITTKINDFNYLMPRDSSVKLSYINSFLRSLDCSIQPIECQDFFNTILEIYFQLSLTTYAMYLNNFVHNDLHTGNVWVKRTDSTNIKYTLRHVQGNPSYTLTSCKNFVMLYDYDRAYRNTIPNVLLNDVEEYNQTNDIIQQRDFVKILCYLMNNLLPKLTDTGTIKTYKLSQEDNEKMRLYYELLSCICKDNTTGFINWPITNGVAWEADRVEWPNEKDRFRDFWNRIFNNLEVQKLPTGEKETDDDYECFLNRSGGTYDINTLTTTSMELEILSPGLYAETLYTMPEIIHNIASLVNKYQPNKIQINNPVNPPNYNYNVRQIIALGNRIPVPPQSSSMPSIVIPPNYRPVRNVNNFISRSLLPY
jgi:hypothetical protein